MTEVEPVAETVTCGLRSKGASFFGGNAFDRVKASLPRASSRSGKHKPGRSHGFEWHVKAAFMAILVFGATGMLGQAIAAEATRRGRALCGVSRRGPDCTIDLAHVEEITPLLEEVAPDLVINAAAITGIDECERDPASALTVNARAVIAMSEYCRRAGIPLVQVSTDHFFTGDAGALHSELAPIALVNAYARTKFLAEAYAGLAPLALILRTNVTGLRGWPGRPTFAEWALDALSRRAPLRLFGDFYTSTIDARSFACALFDLVEGGAAGIVNLAACGVASKRRFVHALADAFGVALDWDEPASVASLAVPRAESLGLDVSKAERLLGYTLPDTNQVCGSLVSQWEEERCAIPLAS
jgi:dTDP-4-dehydrorhamnose reductase